MYFENKSNCGIGAIVISLILSIDSHFFRCRKFTRSRIRIIFCFPEFNKSNLLKEQNKGRGNDSLVAPLAVGTAATAGPSRGGGSPATTTMGFSPFSSNKPGLLEGLPKLGGARCANRGDETPPEEAAPGHGRPTCNRRSGSIRSKGEFFF